MSRWIPDSVLILFIILTFEEYQTKAMKGYIYTMFQGADPGIGWHQTDPIFGSTPTMGACMPNIRRAVDTDDYIFAISGRVHSVKQYVAGGFQVEEKINALAAYHRLPQNRQTQLDDGSLRGNIIVDANGRRNPYDYHSGDLESRIENYIIGKNPIEIKGEQAIAQARRETVEILSDVFQKDGEMPYDIIGRWRRMDEKQIEKLVNWMNRLNRG